LKTIRKAVRKEHKDFTSAVLRARQLYGRISNGWLLVGTKFRALRNPDKRDIAQFLFFDVASQWEAFSTSIFELELKRRYGVRPDVALRVMSDVDGRGFISGYARPDTIRERAEVLLSKNSPWVNLRNALGEQVYKYLFYSYRIRNFIAHAGVGKGKNDFHKLLDELAIPKSERQGLSAGRLLLEYRDSKGKIWFDALLDNYLVAADFIRRNTR